MLFENTPDDGINLLRASSTSKRADFQAFTKSARNTRTLQGIYQQAIDVTSKERTSLGLRVNPLRKRLFALPNRVKRTWAISRWYKYLPTRNFQLSTTINLTTPRPLFRTNRKHESRNQRTSTLCTGWDLTTCRSCKCLPRACDQNSRC